MEQINNLTNEVIMHNKSEEHKQKLHKNIIKYRFMNTFSRRACEKLSEAFRKAKERNHE